ncbi:hypothetical protein KUTeg_023348 [Tegillarca granosa]|uniref:Staphylococcus aureus surface protein A n=1 Tax=Tegillarca granosa TaxID=220873 RepID=A0ABQ9E1D2_TEGGR|nr:hypothetical protein KUTeg_023348 [Tegillarca granosa]
MMRLKGDKLFGVLSLLLLLCTTCDAWTGASYWNDRYGSLGLNYDTSNMFWGLWSDDGGIKENYYGPLSIATGGKTCSGCNCDEQKRIITCTGSTVLIRGYTFDNLTAESFSTSTTSITIISAPSFEIIGNATFDHLTNLREMVILKTGLRHFPDISKTQMERMMLSDNKIKFFGHNHTNQVFPSTLKQLSLIGNEIEWVPAGMFSGSNLEYIGLSRNRLRYIPNEALTGANNLIFLGVDDNLIKYVSKAHIDSMVNSNLRHLNLSNNQITFIQAGCLSLLQKLNILELHNNEIATIPHNTFSNIPVLWHLDLVKNNLKELTRLSFSDLPELRTLRLHSQKTPMTEIYYDAFHNINPHLTNLWISSNALKRFPHPALNQQNYSELQEVYADNNQISDLMEYSENSFQVSMRYIHVTQNATFKPWENYRNIRKFWLSSNSISGFNSSDLCNLTVLEELNLNNNLLEDSTFPVDIFNCSPALRWLSLSSNKFLHVPAAVRSISLVPSLTELYMASNKIGYIETGTFSDTIITTLSLASNKILIIENGSFPSTITSLNLKSNQFRFTHENSFTGLENLVTLQLSSNKIKVIPDSAFHNCTSLSSLDLDNNQISWIKKIYFRDTPLGTRLYLHNNEIGHIEDGTFLNMSSLRDIYLYGNKLTKIPDGGDFEDKSIGSLLLNNNRITKIGANTFRKFSASGFSVASNQISVVESNAFNDVSVNSLSLTGNPLRTIKTLAFNKVSCNTLGLSGMQITHLPTRAFVSVSAQYIQLSGNKIVYIEDGAFEDVQVSVDITLNGNLITSLRGSIFANSSKISRSLYLNSNSLTRIPVNAFDGLTSLQRIYLSNNQILEYPEEALSNKNLLVVDVSSNNITELPLSSFLNQRTITSLTLSNNGLTSIAKGLFDPLTNLKTLTLSGNSIGYVEPNSFAQLTELETMSLSNNQLFFFPKLPNMTQLESLNLANNQIQMFETSAFDDFEGNSNFQTLTLTGNNAIGCSCYVIATLTIVKSAIQGGICGSPPVAIGVVFESGQSASNNYFETKPASTFLCSPLNVQATALTFSAVDITWNRPNDTTLSGTYADDSTWQYRVTCNSSSTGDVLQATVTGSSHSFTSTDGILPDTEYICSVALKPDASSISAESQPAVIRTAATTATANSSASANDWVLTMLNYDFSVAHSDFTGFADAVISSPQYVPSPFGSWLLRSNDPASDSFSSWFVDNPGTNYAFNSTIVLSVVSLSPPTHRYISNAFYPVDDKGYGNQEKDCYFNSHNFGFTTAIRSGFVYQGTETVAIGGGDDLWLYLNGILVLEVSTRNMGSVIPCKKISIVGADQNGGMSIVPQEGIVINSQCVVTTALPREAVNLELELGGRFHFSLFHTERLPCSSSLYIETTNFQFITSPIAEQPRDYVTFIDENYHIDGVVQELVLADIFSAGPPFQVTLLSDCSTSSTLTPEGNDPSTEFFIITTSKALVVLDSDLDYEVKTEYTLSLHVVDPGLTPERTGSITIKIKVKDVNDNCPELTRTAFEIIADPALQIAALAIINGSDIDSGINSELSFYVSSIVEIPPLAFNSSLDLYNVVYAANTTLTFSVIVIDGGNPVRGAVANVSLTLDNSCLVDVEYKPISYNITINSSNGELYLRIPGYYSEEYACLDALGIASGAIQDSQISVSSAITNGGNDRSRLNMTALSQDLGGLTGGWVAAVDDTNQWIQVNLSTLHYVHIVQLQGREDEANWVTSLSIYYSNDSSNWIQYINSTGNATFEGTFDQNSIVNISLNPPIYGKHIRLIPLIWVGHVSLRFELIGCSQVKHNYYRTTCQRCLTSWYCPGDSTILPCGRCDPPQANSTCGKSATEHSFGAASECTTCPQGWRCEDGIASPCPDYTYINCTEDDCPVACLECGSGYACRGGVRYLCGNGTFSSGQVVDILLFICKCTVNLPCWNNSACINTEPGYQCRACPYGYLGTYEDAWGITLHRRTFQLYNTELDSYPYQRCDDVNECNINHGGCDPNAYCHNTIGSFYCGICKDGYYGESVSGCKLADFCKTGEHSCDINAECIYTAPQEYKCQCKNGWAGNGFICGEDPDQDGIPTDGLSCNDSVSCVRDNCAVLPNSGQEDNDNDWLGDECDPDDDNDYVYDVTVNQTDTDGDNIGDVCDNCRTVSNNAQTDTDYSGIGDSCSTSQDSYIPLQNKLGKVSDLTSDFCDTDIDGDGILNINDNCIYVSNPSQTDLDGNHVGDDCESDTDNDGVIDRLDVCPKNKFISESTFKPYISLDLNPSLTAEAGPSWELRHNGREIRQHATTMKPVALIGDRYFDNVVYTGTTYAADDSCYGYIGFIFGYQSTKRYYLVSWRHRHLNIDGEAGVRGVQLRLVNTNNLPSTTAYADSLFYSNDVTSYTTLLWQDPNLKGWECRVSYRWSLYHSPSIGFIRVVVKGENESLIADSNYLYDTSINGGRLGVFAFNQSGVTWSNLKTECTDRLNYALSFNGSSYGEMTSLSSYRIQDSFTIEMWIYLPTSYAMSKLPLVCTNDSTLCVYIENGNLRCQVGSTIVNGSTTITAQTWTHVLARYNAQEGVLTLYVNGLSNGKNAEMTDISESQLLRIYNVQIPDVDIDYHWQQSGLEREYNIYTVTGHYTMDNNTESSTILSDSSPQNLNVKLYDTTFVEITQLSIM